jgi:hypothetical protein
MADWLLAVEEILEQLAIHRTAGDIKVARDILNRIASDNMPLADLLMRHIHARAKLLAAAHDDSVQAKLELLLADEMARSLARAMWFAGELDIPDELLLELRKGELQQHQIAMRAFDIWTNAGCTHGHDLSDWFQAELDLCRRR